MTTAAGYMEVFEATEPIKAIADAKVIVVKTPSDRKLAADLWDSLRAFRKKAEAQKEERCRPLKKDWEDAKKPFDDFMKECQGHETRLQGLMSTYDREQDRLARVEQDRLQAIIDKKNEKILAKAEERGVEAVLKVAPVVQAPARAIETQAGTKQHRISKKVYHIKGEKDGEFLPWDASAQPVADLLRRFPELFVLDRVRFNGMAKSGVLDNHINVSIEETFVYAQRG